VKHPRLALLLVLLLSALALTRSGQFLVLNQPHQADVIVVLAGETECRPVRGIELLDQGYAPRLILDVPEQAKIYQWSQPELAQKYVQSLPRASAIMICPINGLSTRDEAREVGHCLGNIEARRVLLVTSDYHTRRALSIFSRVLPQYQYSIAAAYDPREFGAKWWEDREWAKVNFDEWIRLLWWEAVDRWH
jgi:uncharacterized SAM-binding protein YcdF (DUF218 family)